MKGISETAFATQVEHLLRQYGWRFMHIKPSVMQSGRWASSMNPEGKGYPDYTAVRRGRLLFIELKSERGKISPDQEEWLDDLINVARHTNFQEIQVYEWRPHMVEEISEILR